MQERIRKSRWQNVVLLLAVIAFAVANAAAQSSAVHGTGTPTVLPVWTDANTIGNSTLTQNGGNLSTSGSISAASFAGDGSAVSNVNAAKLGGIAPNGFAQLAASSNAFSGNVFVGGEASVAGTLSGGTVRSGNGGFQFGTTQVLSILPGLFNLYVGQAAGQGSGTNNTGSNNTATGYHALFSNTSGSYNTASGGIALYSNTTGNSNVAVGIAALSSNTDGGSNTAVGAAALTSNTDGNDNTAIGNSALYYNTTGVVNTGTGNNALINNTTGSANTVAGDGAMYGNSTGSGNVAIGRLSLGGLGSGNNNTALGTGAGGNFSGSESDNVEINNGGVAGESGVIRIGTAGTQTATYIAGIQGVMTGQSGAIPVLVDSNGQLGTVSSSRRYKEDIHDMGSASEGLLRLRPVTFRYKKPYADGSKPVQYGLIAEEVAEVYPDLVVRNRDGQLESVQYYKLDVMLLNEVQKLTAAHKADELEVAKLRSQIAEQQAAMKQVLAQVRMLQASVPHIRTSEKNQLLADASGSAKH
jgi:hypothetical protein